MKRRERRERRERGGRRETISFKVFLLTFFGFFVGDEKVGILVSLVGFGVQSKRKRRILREIRRFVVGRVEIGRRERFVCIFLVRRRRGRCKVWLFFDIGGNRTVGTVVISSTAIVGTVTAVSIRISI